jgi:hypothetical protein
VETAVQARKRIAVASRFELGLPTRTDPGGLPPRIPKVEVAAPRADLRFEAVCAVRSALPAHGRGTTMAVDARPGHARVHRKGEGIHSGHVHFVPRGEIAVLYGEYAQHGAEAGRLRHAAAREPSIRPL